jgi:hypothetical protein
MAETMAEEVARLQREIAERQGRLAALVLGDQRQAVTGSTVTYPWPTPPTAISNT